MWSRSFLALTTTVEIHLDSDLLLPAIVAITGSYPTSDEPVALHFVVEADATEFRILREQEVIEDQVAAIDVASLLELDMLRTCVACAVDHVVLHAAAVSIGEATLVMVGPSGAGKTTLTRALLQTGATYRSDECVAISADGRVHGLARPIHLGDGADKSVDAARLHQHSWVDESDAVVCDLLWHPPFDEKLPPGVLKSLVLVSYAPDSPADRVALSSGQALALLWPCVLNPSEATLEALTALVEERPVFSVRSSSVDAGCALVRRGLP